MRTRPSAASTIAAGETAAMTLTAPAGTTIADYATSYRGERTSRGWSMSLLARGASAAQTTLVACDAGVPARRLRMPWCRPRPPTSPRARLRPSGSRCRPAPRRCPGGWSASRPADARTRTPRSWTCTAPRSRSPTRTRPRGRPSRDLGDGVGHHGMLVGTVDAFDAGSGVRRVEVTFAGVTQTSSPPCDYSMPRPCPARDSVAIAADARPLHHGPHRLTVTVTDASGRSTTTSRKVVVGARADARGDGEPRPTTGLTTAAPRAARRVAALRPAPSPAG